MGELHVILGSGPLGRFTAEALVEKGYRVRILSRRGFQAQPPAGVELAKADILDTGELLEHLRGATSVYQCAQPAYHRWVQEFPALQTAALEGAARAGAKFIAAENLYMYGNTSGKPMTESTPYNPCSRKGEVRTKMTESLFQAHREGKIRAASVRGSDFFGPWEPINGEMIFRRALRGKPLNLLGRSDVPHTFTYVKDFGRALALAGTTEKLLGRSWHVPSGAALTQGDLAGLLERHLGRPVKYQTAGKLLLTFLGVFSPAAGELVEMLYEFNGPFIMDGTAMEEATGLKETPMETRIQETLAWVNTASPLG